MIPSSFDSEDRIYAIDLNVFFDVGKRRSNEKDAGKVIAAVMRGDIKGVITQEFVEELERNTRNFRHDPFLALAQRLRVLPAPKKANSLASIESQLAAAIFPHRCGTEELSPQEQSDVRHLSTAIHHKIDGFITSDQAILRSQAVLRDLFGLDLLAPSDFADDADISSKSGGIYEFQEESFSQLLLEPLNSENLDSVTQFLAEQGENEAAAKLKLHPYNPLMEQNSLLVWSGKRLVAFSCWRLSKSSLRSADIWLFVDEQDDNSNLAIDISFNQIFDVAAGATGAKLSLELTNGSELAKSEALSRGFRPPPDCDNTRSILTKVALGQLVSAHNWTKVRRWLISAIGVSLPKRPPIYRSPTQTIEVEVQNGDVSHIPLDQLEMLLSPAIFVLPGRAATIVPIRKVYADQLLGSAPQQDLFGLSAPSLRCERAYFSDSRSLKSLQPGTLILFYESGAKGGRQSVTTVARVSDSTVMNVEELPSDIRRMGVVNEETMKAIGKRMTKLVTHFDNILVIKRHVSLDRLRELGCDAGTNFISATEIQHDQLDQVLMEGQCYE